MPELLQEYKDREYFLRLGKIISIVDEESIAEQDRAMGSVLVEWIDGMGTSGKEVKVCYNAFNNVFGSGIITIPSIDDVVVCLRFKHGYPIVIGWLDDQYSKLLQNYQQRAAGFLGVQEFFGEVRKLISGETLIKSRQQAEIYLNRFGGVKIQTKNQANLDILSDGTSRVRSAGNTEAEHVVGLDDADSDTIFSNRGKVVLHKDRVVGIDAESIQSDRYIKTIDYLGNEVIKCNAVSRETGEAISSISESGAHVLKGKSLESYIEGLVNAKIQGLYLNLDTKLKLRCVTETTTSKEFSLTAYTTSFEVGSEMGRIISVKGPFNGVSNYEFKEGLDFTIAEDRFSFTFLDIAPDVSDTEKLVIIYTIYREGGYLELAPNIITFHDKSGTEITLSEGKVRIAGADPLGIYLDGGYKVLYSRTNADTINSLADIGVSQKVTTQ